MLLFIYTPDLLVKQDFNISVASKVIASSNMYSAQPLIHFSREHFRKLVSWEILGKNLLNPEA